MNFLYGRTILSKLISSSWESSLHIGHFIQNTILAQRTHRMQDGSEIQALGESSRRHFFGTLGLVEDHDPFEINGEAWRTLSDQSCMCVHTTVWWHSFLISVFVRDDSSPSWNYWNTYDGHSKTETSLQERGSPGQQQPDIHVQCCMSFGCMTSMCMSSMKRYLAFCVRLWKRKIIFLHPHNNGWHQNHIDACIQIIVIYACK
jgi:hypothetical protein